MISIIGLLFFLSPPTFLRSPDRTPTFWWRDSFRSERGEFWTARSGAGIMSGIADGCHRGGPGGWTPRRAFPAAPLILPKHDRTSAATAVAELAPARVGVSGANGK